MWLVILIFIIQKRTVNYFYQLWSVFITLNKLFSTFILLLQAFYYLLLILYYFLWTKSGSVSFFFIFQHYSHHPIGCYPTNINYLLISLLHVFCCLHLLHQAINLTWIIDLGLSLSKLSTWRLIWLRSTLTRSISSLKSVALPKSAITKTWKICH